MASNNNNNDLPNKFPLTGTTCGPPKAQLPLQKILLSPNSSTPNQVHHVNASAAAASSSSTSLSVLNVSEYDSVPMGYNLFDLNHPPPPETHHDSPSPVLHGAAEKFQECNLKSPEEKKVTSMLLDESCENEMETNNVGLGSNSERPPESKERAEIKEVGEGEREVRKSEIRFGALLDAVECAMVEEYGGTPSELSKGEERNESTGKKRQRVEWKTGDEEEEKSAMAAAAAAEEVSTSPVVKSNRGRIQVLPCKYRDSVIEPLTHLSSRHSRSSPSSHHLFHHDKEPETHEDYEKEKKHHKHREELGGIGAMAAGAYALHEKHEAKKDPEHAHRHKIEEEVAAAVGVGAGGFAFHEHHEKKETKKEEEEAEGKKKHHFFG